MEHESFENEKIAALMNELFVSIKVDREERPDLDEIYMSAVQVLTGRGGWPMTMFLTPEGKPFYGGTYFPPEDRQGMPGFPRILLGVSQAYRERPADIEKSVSAFCRSCNAVGVHRPKRVSPRRFWRAPIKFPVLTTQTTAAWDMRRISPTPCLRDIPSILFPSTANVPGDGHHTLTKMAQAVFTITRRRFHRYSVDAKWLGRLRRCSTTRPARRIIRNVTITVESCQAVVEKP